MISGTSQFVKVSDPTAGNIFSGVAVRCRCNHSHDLGDIALHGRATAWFSSSRIYGVSFGTIGGLPVAKAKSITPDSGLKSMKSELHEFGVRGEVIRLVWTARAVHDSAQFDSHEARNCDATCLGNVVFTGELSSTPPESIAACQLYPILVAEFSLLFVKLDCNKFCGREAGDRRGLD
eukprot:s3479_g4.t1